MGCFKFLCYVFVIVLISAEYLASQIRQEGAVLNYCNPKYMKDCYAITRRLKRGDSYKTNFTGVSLQTWNNNVTVRLVFLPEGIPIEVLKVKICDAERIDWLSDFILTYFTETSVCPILPGLHGLLNIEVPPKKMPDSILKIFKGKIKFYLLITKTDEVIVETTVTIRVNQ